MILEIGGMNGHKVVIAGDIGGTNVRLSLIGIRGEIYSIIKKEVKEASREDPSLFLAYIKDWCRDLIEEAGRSGLSVVGLGFGIAGKIDYRKGVVVFSPNLPVINGIPLVSELSLTFSLPVALENDANVFGLGEAWMGCAVEWKNWLGITLGTGVGGCIFFDGKLWRGDEEAGFAGEIGHTTVIPDGFQCACGKKGCLEAYSSEGGLKRQVLADVREDWKHCPVKPSDPEFYLENSGDLTARDLFRQAERGDVYAKYLFDRFGRMLGIGISNVFTTLGIYRAVIGGGVSNAWNFFECSLYRALKEHCSMLDVEKVVILKSLLGDRAALLGAAKCAFEMS